MATSDDRPFEPVDTDKISPDGNDIPVISSNHPMSVHYFYITEKFTYNFDFPDQPQPGYVEIDNNKIVVMFPEQDRSTHVQKYPHLQTIQFYLNRQLVFSYDWLPIYSVNDFYRVKDMVAKSFEEFSHKTHRNQFMSQKTPYAHSKQFDEIYTVCETDKFNLNCLEDPSTTSLTLDLKAHLNSSPTSVDSNPIHVQYYIGSNLVFCTERDLAFLDTASHYFVTQFILHKLIKA